MKIVQAVSLGKYPVKKGSRDYSTSFFNLVLNSIRSYSTKKENELREAAEV